MEYTTYWSILDSPSHTIKSNIISLLITLIAFFLGILIKKFKKDDGSGERMLLLYSTGIFSILGIVMFFLLTFMYPDNSNTELAKLLDSQKFNKVEGIISNFQRKFRNSKLGTEKIETFTVKTIQFAYGDAALGKFNSFAKTNNDVIYNGQAVRITYGMGSNYGDNFNTIMKLEIRK